MGVNDPDPVGSKIQLEILRERQKHSEDRIRQMGQELSQAYTNLGRKEKELEQAKQEHTKLNIKWEVLKKDLQHTQDSLAKNSQASAKKRTAAKLQAFFASIIFLISSVLVNNGEPITIEASDTERVEEILKLVQTLHASHPSSVKSKVTNSLNSDSSEVEVAQKSETDER
jgi:chromosome segregation ATPase